MSHKLLLEWDLKALACALRIPEPEVLLYFRDGRRISFILERRIRDAFPNWMLAPSEGSGFDLVDDQGCCWEVRSISSHIYFCPSSMVGSGRRFSEPGFHTKLDGLGGYICSDITKFPQVPVFIVPASLIRELYLSGSLGLKTSISRAKFYSLIVPALDTVAG